MVNETRDLRDPPMWRIESQEIAFENRWLSVAVDQVRLPDGEIYAYTRLRPASAGVAVIGFNAENEVLLEREYRHGVGQVIWQLPGGLQGEEEELQSAGLRELREETGFTPRSPDSIRYLGCIWDNPAFGTGQSHIFVAWDLVRDGQVERDPAEYVTLHWQSATWLCEAVRSGEISDRVVVAAVCYLLLDDLLP